MGKIRKYVDVNGRHRNIRYVGPGYPAHFWKTEPGFDTSSIWLDIESESKFQIPDSAWLRLDIQFTDEEEL